jgi:hypothetical protein
VLCYMPSRRRPRVLETQCAAMKGNADIGGKILKKGSFKECYTLTRFLYDLLNDPGLLKVSTAASWSRNCAWKCKKRRP